MPDAILREKQIKKWRRKWKLDLIERIRQIAREGTTVILITHHIDEIIPEIERVVLLQDGRVAAAGSKRSVLTAEGLSGLFKAPIALEENDGYFYARPGGKRPATGRGRS